MGSIIRWSLINDQGNEETQLTNLSSNRLNIHTIDTMLYKIEFSGIIRVVHTLIECTFDVRQTLPTLHLTIYGKGLFTLTDGTVYHKILPLLICWVNTLQHMNHLLKYSHRKCTRATSWVEYTTMIKCIHDVMTLLFSHRNIFRGIAQELAIQSLILFSTNSLEMSHQALVHHILHNLTRSIERTRLLTSRSLCLRIISSQQILECLSQQLRIETHLLVVRRILLYRKAIMAQDVDDALS